MTKIAVIIPVHNRREVTLNFLGQFSPIASLISNCTFDVVIIDDGSSDGTSEAIQARFPDIKILCGDGNLWWTGAVNMGLRYVLRNSYDTILIMNDDLDLDEKFLFELLAVSAQYPAALVSSIKLNKQAGGVERIITAGFKVQGWLKQNKMLHADEPYRPDMDNVVECDLLTGSSLLIPINVFQQIGVFDNNKFPHHFGDLEFTRKASLAGFRCLVATRSKVYTEYNPDYELPFMLKSTRREYLYNLFNDTKHFYGFQSMVRYSYMHKSILVGTVLFARRTLGLLRKIVLKVILPNQVLRSVMQGGSRLPNE